VAELVEVSDDEVSNYYEQDRKELLKFFKPGPRRILDVGCGAGTFAAGLKKMLGAEVWGIEFDEPAAKRAAGRFDRVACGDVFQMAATLPRAYFDLILFNDMLEHLVDPYSLLRLIQANLAPQGRIFCSIPNFLYFNVMRSLLVYRDFKYEDYGVLDRTHLRFFTRKSMIRMLEEAGYVLELVEGINPKRHWVYRLLNLLFLNGLAFARYQQYVCIARAAGAPAGNA
jgi:2-polyprenyl-3-methyl-5-hydroxy-6-metoxy-1,4-benzoquinol methylase